METKPFSLDNVISQRIYIEGESWQPHVYEITEQQKAAFLKMFAGRCGMQTKVALIDALEDNFSRVKNAYLLRKVMFNTKHRPCEYVAGQDYPGEVTYIRNYIKRFY